MEFDAVIDKTEKGFGIYFAKVAASDGDSHGLAVDGFVEGSEGVGDGQDAPNKEALAYLRLGDLLIRVNGEDCQGKETADVLGLLRAASVGRNTLSFLRQAHQDTELHDDSTAKATEAQKRGLIGALLKVKSKIRAEIDGDEDQLLREQLEDERFEKQWLEEFEVLKKQYEAKWETCTYTADEFCGLLYRSGDAQQKEFLLQQYPTLMEAWKDARASSSGSSRVIPEWPAAKLAYDNSVLYDQTDSSSSSTPASANPRSIHCSRSLQKALECLRAQFMWRSDDLRAFSRRLDADGISSCSTLLEALRDRSAYFERNFQSKEYPRLSKTMLRALLENAEKEVASTSSLPPLVLSQPDTASA
ncbi:hypothetical protein PR003_g12163 [Phytophthora rubi]|uniref:PDZ domain-containing protein n=1 Tax=Phytophthora rubi TaxID=129364 RepID=A0A6A4FDF0_9STRA|nr:hypothetical protein PR002_g11755 [Phytophthora rubi]KAE9029583.1 hypothetical protein PR001_g11490 [Phytophthora rubi]KAE9337117.1 hypothetical protein PR003_g12163 [Phytophthora rubi]